MARALSALARKAFLRNQPELWRLIGSQLVAIIGRSAALAFCPRFLLKPLRHFLFNGHNSQREQPNMPITASRGAMA
jgi:hypothetical protein